MSGQWILCSERMPGDEVEVLLNWHGTVRVGHVLESGFFFSGGMVMPARYVSHWMPFPNPPSTVKGQK